MNLWVLILLFKPFVFSDARLGVMFLVRNTPRLLGVCSRAPEPLWGVIQACRCTLMVHIPPSTSFGNRAKWWILFPFVRLWRDRLCRKDFHGKMFLAYLFYNSMVCDFPYICFSLFFYASLSLLITCSRLNDFLFVGCLSKTLFGL
jgi:hypothetical protein